MQPTLYHIAITSNYENTPLVRNVIYMGESVGFTINITGTNYKIL